MKTWEKIAIGILLFALLVLGIIFVLPLSLEKVLIPYWSRRYSKSSTINVKFDKVQVSMFSTYPYFRVQFDSLTLIGKGEFWQDTLFTCKSVVFLFKFKDLLRSKTSLRGVEADLYSPWFNLLVDSNGTANYDISPGSSTGQAVEYLITFDRVYLNDVRFVYLDKESKIQTYSPQIQAVLGNFQFSGRRAVFNLSLFADDFYFKAGKTWFVRGAAIAIDGYYANIFPFGRDDYFFHGKITINQSVTLSFNGVFKNWNFLAVRPYYDYSLEIRNLSQDFKDFVSALPYFYNDTSLNFDASGEYFFKFRYIDRYFYFNGKKIDTTSIKTDFSITDGKLHFTNFRDTLYDINLHGRIIKTTRTNIYLDYASFFLVKNYFYLKSFHLIHRNNHLYLNGLAYSKFNLDELKNFMPLKYKVAGLLQLNLRLNGYLNFSQPSDLSNLNFSGDLTVENLMVKKDFFVSFEKFLARFNPQNAQILAKNFTINKYDFNSLSLIAKNYFPFLVSSFNHSLKPQKLDLILSLSTNKIDLNQLSPVHKPNAQSETTSPLPVFPANISVKLNLSINQLKTKYLTFYRNYIVATLKPDSLKLIYNGQIFRQANVYLWLVLNQKTPKTAKFYLEISNLDLQNLANLPVIDTGFKPILKQTYGQINIKLNGIAKSTLPYDLKSWQYDINGKLISQKITLPPEKSRTFRRLAKLLNLNQLRNPVLNDINFDFKLNNQQISLLPSNFLLNGLKSQIHGFYDFKTGLTSAKLKLYLPPKMALQSLHKVATGQKNLAVVVRIYGDIHEPKLKIGSNLLKKDIQTYTPQTISMTFKQDSILAQTQVKANKTIEQAKEQAQQILDSARREQLKIYGQARQKIQELKQSGKYTKRRAKKILRKARRKARKIMRKALVHHDKIIRQAYRQATSIKRQARQQNRKIQRTINQTTKPKKKHKRPKKHKKNKKTKAN